MAKRKRLFRLRTNERLNFTPLEESKLIDYVRKHPVLYDMKNCLFRNVIHKKKLWEEIAADLWKTGNQCARKWTSIRDYYIKLIQKKSIVLFPNQWTRQRHKSLEFLNQFIINKRLRKNSFDKDDIIVEHDIYDLKPLAKTSSSSFEQKIENSDSKINDKVISVAILQKNKIDSNQKIDFVKVKSNEQLIDEPKISSLDQFFASMCGTVKIFPGMMQAQAKMKIAQIIGEMEMDFLDTHQKQISENNSRDFSNTSNTSEF